MYFLGWTGLVLITLWISICAFIWALQSGQFSDQQRARYLPLSGGLPPRPSGENPKHRAEGAAMLIIILLAVAAFFAPIVLILEKGKW